MNAITKEEQEKVELENAELKKLLIGALTSILELSQLAIVGQGIMTHRFEKIMEKASYNVLGARAILNIENDSDCLHRDETAYCRILKTVCERQHSFCPHYEHDVLKEYL